MADRAEIQRRARRLGTNDAKKVHRIWLEISELADFVDTEIDRVCAGNKWYGLSLSNGRDVSADLMRVHVLLDQAMNMLVEAESFIADFSRR